MTREEYDDRCFADWIGEAPDPDEGGDDDDESAET